MAIKKVIISANTSWNLVNFRAGLIRALVVAGHEVIAVAPHDEYVSKLKELGCHVVSLPIDMHGRHIGRDLLLFFRYFMIMRQHMPSIYLGFTVKPNIYGSIAAHIHGVPVVNNIGGLGAVFSQKGGWLLSLLRLLYRGALSRSHKIFFQNKDDHIKFIEERIINNQLTDQLPGSGIDLEWFSYVPKIIGDNDRLQFLLLARMLWEKGIGEYITAARIILMDYPNAKFILLGFLDDHNPSAISHSQMDKWVKEGIVEYHGVSSNVKIEIDKVDCVVLPSYYREGVPHALLESAAIGRPIITTDSVGCRETVDDNISGYLCRPQDAVDLAEKMKLMLKLDHKQRVRMGKYGREKMKSEFNEKIIVQKYIEVVQKCC